MSLKDLSDNVLVWFHGRLLGKVGDARPSGGSAVLVLDGIPVATTRGGPGAIPLIATSLSAAGAVTLTGAVVGDNVQKVFDTSAWTDVTSSFESTISVAGQVQQTASTSSHVVQIFLQPQS